MGGIAKKVKNIAGPALGGGLGFALGGPAGAALGMGAGSMLMGGTSDKLFGNNIPNSLQNPRLASFSAPGLSAQVTPDQINMIRAPGVESALRGSAAAFSTQANELGALRPLVEPGMGRLTQAGVNAIRDSRRAAMGDLRQNIARRRVGGSSFAADDAARTEAEFAKRENEFTSQAFVQEMAMTQDLINQQAQAQANVFMQNLNQTNLESGLAAQMSTGVSGMLQGNAQMMGQLSNQGADRLLNVGGALTGGLLSGGFKNSGFSNPFSGFSNPFASSGPTLKKTGNTSFYVDPNSTNPWANPNIGGPRKIA